MVRTNEGTRHERRMMTYDWRSKWQPKTRGGFEVVDVREDKDGDLRICWFDDFDYGNSYVDNTGRYRSNGADDEHDLLPVEHPSVSESDTIAALTAERDGLVESLRIANERVADFENGITTLHLQFGEPYYSWQRVLYRVQQLVRRRNACGEACLNAIGYLRGGSILDEKQLIGRLINAVMPMVNAKDGELPIYEVPALMPTESEAAS